MNYLLHVCVYLSISSMLALSFNLLAGYAGMLTLAHSAYFAIGAYAYAILSTAANFPFVPAILVAMLVAAVMSLAVALPAWRFRGDHFTMISLCVQVLISSTIANWYQFGAPLGSLRNMTNGPYGISGVPSPEVFREPSTAALIFAACAGVVLLVVRSLVRSPWGRMIQAMRDDETVARGLGKHVRRSKVEVCSVAAAVAALAGGLYAAYSGYVTPALASIPESLALLSMVFVGGLGNIRGPLVGAGIYVLVPEGLRYLALSDVSMGHLRLLLFGALLLGVVHLRPQGLAGVYRVE